MILNQRHGVRIPLSTERAEDKAPALLRLACGGQGFGTVGEESRVVVSFVREAAGVWVVAVGRDGGIVDHCAFEMETAVP